MFDDNGRCHECDGHYKHYPECSMSRCSEFSQVRQGICNAVLDTRGYCPQARDHR